MRLASAEIFIDVETGKIVSVQLAASSDVDEQIALKALKPLFDDRGAWIVAGQGEGGSNLYSTPPETARAVSLMWPRN